MFFQGADVDLVGFGTSGNGIYRAEMAGDDICSLPII
jgi:hypothetical protein